MTDGEPLISVRNLKKHYPLRQGFIGRQVGVARAVDGISFDIYPGETLGLVGESGCGKSTAAEAIIRLEEPTAGEVLFNGRGIDARQRANGNGSVIGRLRRLVHRTGSRDPVTTNDVTEFDTRQLKAFRRQAQMVMQDPSSSFNPRMTVGQAVSEMLLIHGMTDRARRRSIVEDLLERVGLSASDYDRFPHEFSGGQKQRIGLARALVLNPEFIIADEPVSALDVSIQAEILALIKELQDEFGLSLLFISHDLSVVRQICDRVAVMYLGEIVEIAETETLFSDPQHPYTEALLSSIPTPDPREKLAGIKLTGEVPSPENPPSGCRFHTRCHRIIQPDGVDIPQEHWRAIVDLGSRVMEERIDPDAIRASVVAIEQDIDDPEEVTDDQFATQLRDEYDIPPAIDDGTLDAAINDGIVALAAGEIDRAQQRFDGVLVTPCRASAPDQTEIATGHIAQCHLLESSQRNVRSERITSK